ncbi:MAG: GH109 [uncultured Chloroflexia bacterium]|uniref:GH109 n=1 Tax=uncultured Chloroflexia bacterium TaxID=1672391 RepID=A0A6J4LPW3_9CHLR|nr:MAG: GH109 [uncultured Chloroflexia bacterium]
METVRLGIIGCGGMGRYHGRRIIQTVPEAEIVALADPNADNLAQFITEVFPQGKQPEATFADYRAMLEAVELDGVIIISPHAHHFQQVMDSIDAGCHVLVEKPMVTRTEDAQAMIAHGRKHDRIISVAFPGPFTREFTYIREVIARGELGEIYLVTGVCAQDWISNVRGTWRTELALSGGGNLYDSGAHMFNAMLYLTGLSVTDVFAFIDNKDQEVDMIASVALRFTKGALGTATVSGDATVMEQGIYIQGTKGSIKTSIYGGELEHWNGKERVKYPVVPITTTLQQNFVDCIKGRDTTPSPPILGLRQARLMDAIYESARRGSMIRVMTDEE